MPCLFFILVEAIRGKEREVFDRISSQIEGVAEAHPIFGEFDIIAKVVGEDEEAVVKTIGAIKKIEGILSIRVLVPIKSSVTRLGLS